MSWRTVIISTRAKLDYKMGYLVVRTDEKTSRVSLEEISVLIIENTAVSITGYLMSELIDNKVKVIFCDHRRNPCAELVAYYGCHDCSEKMRKQIKWTDDIKADVWTQIVAEKIRKQYEFLQELGNTEEADLLKSYVKEIEYNDATNREGHAAKVYFNALFGMGFTRSADCFTNAALNYGYSIILSSFNRECAANGYLTQLGLFHDNMYNFFNLSCDLMEPFRILIDRNVKANKYTSFGPEEKHKLAVVLKDSVIINDNVQYVSNAIKIYCKSVFDAINDGDVSQIKFYKIIKEKQEGEL
ncbi:MAG: type II CRISPR-associated endonuclease Cas1 [Firmicutes bacterium]|nr:type II CRISPR-associated endonuclease Cas1 [Bacillota bacterium]